MLMWLLFSLATIIPMFKLLPHFGINPYWSFICITGIGTVALVWFMAIRLQDLEKR